MPQNIPDTENTFSSFLQEIYKKYLPFTKGNITDVPAHLMNADPDDFAVSAVSVKGDLYSAGDSHNEITIQSISKPFVYGMVLEQRGEEHVRKVVGVEPTGDAFNSLIRHEEIIEGRYNPMVNVGAVTTTSMVKGESLEDRIAMIKDLFSGYMGRDAQFDEEALSSRKKLDNINRAIGYFMLSEGRIESSVEETVELFAHQCSILANCDDLAVMAATLANGGVNPVTGKRIVSLEYVKNILSVMFMSGMYDFSGQWAYRAGLPAKSGLAGAIIAVVPGQMGLAAYSPLLGPHFKSVRGVRAIEEISEKYDYHVFHRITDHCTLSEKAESILSREGEFTSVLEGIRERYLDLKEGEIYTADPDLKNGRNDQFGICVVTTDGFLYEAGDSQDDFFIQSVSKLFAYGLALEDHGREKVQKKVDVEPTGDAYNAIIKLEESSKRPHNPMVNAGGIAVSSLIRGSRPAVRLNRILQMYAKYAGRQVFIDAPAFVAEQDANDKNWAISYLLKNFGMIDEDIKQTMDLYLQQCSAVINCRDLAMMGATLANDGINPVTGERAVKADYIKDLLTVMHTCGMYDFAGEWAYNIGIPAKSGVSGCILGVVPGQMGIAVFSPPLDQRGNSIRGIKVFEDLSKMLELHVFHPH